MADNEKSVYDKKPLLQSMDFLYTITLGVSRLLIVFCVDMYQKHRGKPERKKKSGNQKNISTLLSKQLPRMIMNSTCAQERITEKRSPP